MKSKYFAPGSDIPKKIKRVVYHNLWYWHMDLYDALDEAVRNHFNDAPKELQDAFMKSDYRKYIPSVYLPEYL